jgi:hypothetical protein
MIIFDQSIYLRSPAKLAGHAENSSLFDEFVCKLGLFWHAWAILKRGRFTPVLKWPTRAKKGPIYTRTS